MSQKISFEEYKIRLEETTKDIIPISKYTGWNKPITYKCLVCNHEWDTKEARSVIRGYGCPKCAKQKKSDTLIALSKSRIKSEEQFRKELEEKQPNLIPNDTYIGGKTKYHCICKIHDCDVYKTPQKMLLRDQGCDLCSIEKSKKATRYDDNTYKIKLNEINPTIKILSKYKNVKSRINVECKICGHKWSPITESLISKTPCGCPNCAGNAKKTPEGFESELKLTHPELSLISPYKSANKKVHVLCNDCNNDFWVTPNKLQQGQHCPYCNISNGEREIKRVLDNLNIKYDMYYKFDGLIGCGGRQLSYDFYLHDYNLLIENQGEQHERPVNFTGTLTEEECENNFKKQVEHDKRKRDYALQHNIKLLEIWYYDFENIENIITNTLQSNIYKSA